MASTYADSVRACFRCAHQAPS